MFVIQPEHITEVLDRLCGCGDWDKEWGSYAVGPQDNMYKFFDREQMTPEEIEELEKHRT